MLGLLMVDAFNDGQGNRREEQSRRLNTLKSCANYT